MTSVPELFTASVACRCRFTSSQVSRNCMCHRYRYGSRALSNTRISYSAGIRRMSLPSLERPDRPGLHPSNLNGPRGSVGLGCGRQERRKMTNMKTRIKTGQQILEIIESINLYFLSFLNENMSIIQVYLKYFVSRN